MSLMNDFDRALIQYATMKYSFKFPPMSITSLSSTLAFHSFLKIISIIDISWLHKWRRFQFSILLLMKYIFQISFSHVYVIYDTYTVVLVSKYSPG
jgi:hypothetical protein